MVQETYTVIFIDTILNFMVKVPGMKRVFDMQITGERTNTLKDLYHLEIVDLEPNISNRLGVEIWPNEPKFYPCPHHIVTNVVGIIRELFLATLSKQEEKKSPEMLEILASLEEIKKELFLAALSKQ